MHGPAERDAITEYDVTLISKDLDNSARSGLARPTTVDYQILFFQFSSFLYQIYYDVYVLCCNIPSL